MSTSPTGSSPVSYEVHQQLLEEHRRICQSLEQRNETILQLRQQLEEQSQAFEHVARGLTGRAARRESQVKRLTLWTKAAKIGTVCLGVIAVAGCAVAGVAVIAVMAAKS